MQKTLKLIVLFLFLISGVFAFSDRSPILLSAADAVNSDDKKMSRDLFQQNCARCHGADGKSETELGRLFDAPDLTNKNVRKMGGKKIARIILNGKNGMPAFSKKLNSVQIRSLADYVRSLR